MRRFKNLPSAAWAGLCLLILLCGCHTSVSRLDVGPVKRINPGTSTMAEVERIFGPAPTRLAGASGKSVARYVYNDVRISEDAGRYERHWRPGHLLIRSLSVLYDSRGVVEKVLHDESFTPIQRVGDWLEVGPVLQPDEPSSIRKGETTAAELKQRFGEPMVHTLDPDGHTCLHWYYMKDRVDRLGTPVGRVLIAVLDDQQRVIDLGLVEENPRYWLFSRGDYLVPEWKGRTQVGGGQRVEGRRSIVDSY